MLQGWDYYLYYLLVIYYKYIEFSLMIRICAILLTFCLTGFVVKALHAIHFTSSFRLVNAPQGSSSQVANLSLW